MYEDSAILVSACSREGGCIDIYNEGEDIYLLVGRGSSDGKVRVRIARLRELVEQLPEIVRTGEPALIADTIAVTPLGHSKYRIDGGGGTDHVLVASEDDLLGLATQLPEPVPS